MRHYGYCLQFNSWFITNANMWVRLTGIYSVATLRVGLLGTGPPSFVFGSLSFLTHPVLRLAHSEFLCLAHPVL